MCRGCRSGRRCLPMCRADCTLPCRMPWRCRGSSSSTATRRRPSTQVRQGSSVVIVTGTASGKTLCYNIPVVETLLEDPLATALFIYPDQGPRAGPAARAEQVSASRSTGSSSSPAPTTATRPQNLRRKLRDEGNVILTNPDMLHQGILPQHARWNRFFTHLKYVVLDEVHAYRGVFGSHLANVLRRLQRICAHYGVDAAVHLLLGHHRQPARARRAHHRRSRWSWWTTTARPRGPKQFVFWNPPPLDDRGAAATPTTGAWAATAAARCGRRCT